MSLYDFDNKRQYTKYKRHVNDSTERIDASTVNKLQQDITIKQQNINSIKDNDFEERVYTIFNNNLYTNAMFIDYYKNGNYLDKNKSTNIIIDYPTSQLYIDPKLEVNNGTAISMLTYSTYGSEVEINDFFLVANEYVPIGSSIKYYIETSTGQRYPITPNSIKLPMHLTTNLTHGFRLIAELKTNALGESPKLNGYAVLYWDAAVEEALGMTNPDLRRFP